MTTPPNAGEPVARPYLGKYGTDLLLREAQDRLAKKDDPYPWLARGAIPPYQPPFPG